MAGVRKVGMVNARVTRSRGANWVFMRGPSRLCLLPALVLLPYSCYRNTQEPVLESPELMALNSGPDSTTANSDFSAVNNQDEKKRKLDHDGFRNSKYFKICAIVKDVRPFFVEVSRTPNFRESKAAQEILIQMKTLVELTKQLRSEGESIAVRVDEPSQTHVKEENEEKPVPLLQPGEDTASSVAATENGK